MSEKTVEMEVGATAEYSRTVTEDDIVAFAEISGDDNPVHLDEEYAAGTVFKGRIAHGILSLSFISTVLGTKLPGPGCIYLEQNSKFKKPVYPGDTVIAKVEVLEYDPKTGKASLATTCHNQDGALLIEGSARILFRE